MKIFKRYEYKYMLTLEQLAALKELMEQYMIADVFGRSTICNLYFDTPQYLLIRRSIENHVYKEKIRLRTYGQATPDTTAFIELKKKYKKVVYKRRISAGYEDAMQYLCQRADVIPHTQICSELNYALSLYIVVDVEDSEKVQIVFDNVSITNESGAAVYVRQADKVFLTLAEGSENTIVSNGTTTVDDSNIDGAIFAKDDLTINGTGSLNVTSAAHGIVCKDDLVVTGGTYCITAEKQGFSGKDSVRIADGTFEIISGGDAIHSENEEDENKGFVYVADGNFTLNADGDGISASYVVQLDDGTYKITAGGGSANAQSKNPMGEMEPGNMQNGGGTPPDGGTPPQINGQQNQDSTDTQNTDTQINADNTSAENTGMTAENLSIVTTSENTDAKNTVTDSREECRMDRSQTRTATCRQDSRVDRVRTTPITASQEPPDFS